MRQKTAPNEAIEKSIAAARQAHLRYTSPDQPGYGRRKRGTAFVYETARGKRITDSDTLARIKSLVIPPAWKDLWITPHANGHLQVVGTDARGRKQYR